MRWLVSFCLILTGCAGLDLHRDESQPQGLSQVESPEQVGLESLLDAVKVLTEEENRRPLDGFIATHPADSWGLLAIQFREFYNQILQLRKQNQAAMSESAQLSRQTLQQKQKLQELQSQLTELTRSIIKQESRQP
jgi:hypothetical protein